ncbi:hypothetical protein GCM10011514_45230 [Emticicia aquatilis]|uniref:Uncharacterized protein n=1 Tax=Emticicia aquatilis TaxID=1537369 RepID=A0A917DXJ3_9BACT|nr:hypothetical protein GCM10011514_45230 [Emticicia aquatilis]
MAHNPLSNVEAESKIYGSGNKTQYESFCCLTKRKNTIKLDKNMPLPISIRALKLILLKSQIFSPKNILEIIMGCSFEGEIKV